MRWLRSSLKNLFSDYRGSMRLLAPIGSCIGDILGSVALLLGPLDHQGRPTEPGTVQSEAELRFAIADPVTTDPITRMVCKCWGYKVMLEETVWDSSKHYSLYTIKNDKTVVAVLMEVKLTSHKKFQHALGQLLGYYVKFGTDGENPPLCALLSETGMQVVCFPYCLETTVQPVPVVDCLVLPELPLFTATCIPTVNQSLLVVILLLTDEDVHFYKKGVNVNLLPLKDATRKSLETHIQSLNEMMADELCEMEHMVEDEIEDEERKRVDVERKREDEKRKRKRLELELQKK